jgi:hypothetical protein
LDNSVLESNFIYQVLYIGDNNSEVKSALELQVMIGFLYLFYLASINFRALPWCSKYRSLFPHVSAAIQSKKYPLKGDTIQYIYTDSKHNNPLCRVTPIENLTSILSYDREKYKEMILDAAETVLGFFGFDRTAHDNINFKKNRKWQWYEGLREQSKRYRNGDALSHQSPPPLL